MTELVTCLAKILAKILAAEQPKALSTQCQEHSLNLGIKTTMANSKQMKAAMGTVAYRDHFVAKVLT